MLRIDRGAAPASKPIEQVQDLPEGGPFADEGHPLAMETDKGHPLGIAQDIKTDKGHPLEADIIADAGHPLNIAPDMIARSFGQAARHYDRHAELQRQVADQLATQLRSGPPPATILDLGCGTGYCSDILRRRYPDATLLAVDLAMPMLQLLAARNLSAVLPACGNAEVLPLCTASLDLVLSSLTIQWCADPLRLFAELWRVMRPGGQVLLSTFGPATLRELRDAWAGVDTLVHVNEFVDKTLLEGIAHRAGFEGTIRTGTTQRHYDSLRSLARELKGVGAHNMNAGRASGLTSRAAFRQAEAAFSRGLEPGLGIPVTWDVLYLDLRKP